MCLVLFLVDAHYDLCTPSGSHEEKTKLSNPVLWEVTRARSEDKPKDKGQLQKAVLPDLAQKTIQKTIQYPKTKNESRYVELAEWKKKKIKKSTDK